MSRDDPNEITAHQLSGEHIGMILCFDTHLGPGKVRARITAELRQISHSSSEVVLNLASHTLDTAGEMSEFALQPGDVIVVNP